MECNGVQLEGGQGVDQERWKLSKDLLDIVVAYHSDEQRKGIQVDVCDYTNSLSKGSDLTAYE